MLTIPDASTFSLALSIPYVSSVVMRCRSFRNSASEAEAFVESMVVVGIMSLSRGF
jgi:hypothetical protein